MTFSKLGTDTETNQPVYLPKTARTQGLYIIGIQGTGKSGLIENLIMQDIDQQIGVCVLDPHGELIDHVIARLPGKTEEDKVIFLDLADYKHPFGLNLLACPDPTDDGEIVKTLYQVLHVFEKAYGIVPTTPLMYDLLYNTVYMLIANPGYTMIDIRLLLTNEACRKNLAKNVPNDDIKDFWTIWDDPKQTTLQERENKRGTILNKMNEFSHVPLRNIVGQSTTSFDLEDMMNTGKILLVKLSRRLEQPSNLIGSIIVAQLLNAAYARPVNKRKQFHLYADEFQNFATEDFATLLEEARKFGIATTLAHQNRGQLNSANSQLETDLKDRSRSVGNMVVFKINSKDADDLAGEFDTTPPPPTPEEKTRRAIPNPVMEPIQYMVSHGAHPLAHTRKFMERFGKQLVELAKREEELERDSRHEMQRYVQALEVGTRGYVAPPIIEVTYHQRNLLKMFNTLFYQAIMAGKQGKPVDALAISAGVIDDMIRIFWMSGYRYLELLETYQHSISQLHIQVTDYAVRTKELQDQLAAITSARQEKVTSLRRSKPQVEENLRLATKQWLLVCLKEVRERFIIVKKGSVYATAYKVLPVYKREVNDELMVHEDERASRSGRRYRASEWDYDTPSFLYDTWEDAVRFYLAGSADDWYRISEAMIFDKRYWTQRISQVWWQRVYYVQRHPPIFASRIDKHLSRYHGFDRKEETRQLSLQTWELKPGVEHNWYTEARLADITEYYCDSLYYSNAYPYDLDVADLAQAGILERDRRIQLASKLGNVGYHGFSYPARSSPSEEYLRALEQQSEWNEKLSGVNNSIIHFSGTTDEIRKLEEELDQLNQIAAAKHAYDTMVEIVTTELREIMRELATPAGRVEESSGIQEVVMGHGIQLSSAEMEARISNQLVSLPMSRFEKFALVKIAENIPQNPGKKCVSCAVVNNPGVLYCVQCQTRIIGANEYTIKTIKPPDVNTQLLEQRVKRILANNIRSGNVRERATVEAEITKRQTGCSGGAAPVHPPQQPSPQPPRHARQVPVQANCPNCGKSILPGSTFCNQCGMKLT